MGNKRIGPAVVVIVEVAEEVARKVSADWIVKPPDVVFQVEAAAPVRLRELVAVMELVLMVMVLPIVVVAA